ncbi:PEP-CTERM sorting domain-containing protein [uncultured Marinobacter sp.]|uniref:PEP-CTERM sorting domain-containing protein n=1 Tax=uncultured Marinobacter sp. TaxID=187379 RepID=UPI0025D19505|nr:PEP-CTERM sorting domain-containing protein [uncultured Marinobacter sp.]
MHWLIQSFLFVLALSTGLAQATPLKLDYSVEDVGAGLFNYEFYLTLDSNDGSWAPGQGWGWLVFGDAQFAATPLTDFVGDPNDLPIGPWTVYGNSFGAHNGPTLQSVVDYWVPNFVGETLNWSGTSTADLLDGDLLFSTLVSIDGGVRADFEVATRIPPIVADVPEPSSLGLIGLGLVGLTFIRGRRAR